MNGASFRSISLVVCLSIIMALLPQPAWTGLAREDIGGDRAPLISAALELAGEAFPAISSPLPASLVMTGTIASASVSTHITTTSRPSDSVTYLPVVLNGAAPASEDPASPTDSTVWIENVWVDSSNNLYTRINGTPNYYRLYVRRVGATFGDAPHYQYYQIYSGGTWPKDLWIVSDVLPGTVYCVEMRSNDGSYRHDITSYRTGGGSKPYTGAIYLDDYCPVDYSGQRVRLVGASSSLGISPSSPIVGQSVQATFGRVCNDGAVAANLGTTRVRTDNGDAWASVDAGTLICGQCRTINYSKSRSFSSSGQRTAMAGYYSGTWRTFGARDGATNSVTFNVLTPADVRLKNGTALSLSKRKISPGQSVRAEFTVHNYGQASVTERFRAAIYDKVGASYIATFPATGDRVLAGGGEFTYSQTYAFSSSGVYWIVAQHREDGVWKDLAGDGRLSLRVVVPPPEDDPKVKGTAPPCPKAGEPVNTATGNFTSMHTDWLRPGPGLSFRLARFYNSVDAGVSPGPLGYGWTHSYQYSFDWRIDDTAVITLTDGHIAYFEGDLGDWETDPDPGTYTADDGVLDTLVRDTHGTPGQWADDTFVLTTPDQVQYYFDTDQRLVRIGDRSGNTQHLSYDGSDRLVQILDTANVTYTLSYSDSLITSIASSNGESISYGYDGAGNLIAFTNTAGETMAYTYDENHRLLTGIDSSGRLFVENIYDDQGRVVEQRDAEGNVSTFGYDALSQTTVYLDALGNPLTQIYDEQHRLILKTDALGHSVSYSYDADDNVIAVQDKNGNVTQYTYDDRGNMLSKTDALGYVWTYTYDGQNNLLTETDPLNHTTSYDYDAEGRLIRKTDPEGGVWQYAHNALGLTVWQQDPVGAETWFEYNDLGQPLTVTNALGHSTLMSYDTQGRKLSYTDAEGNASHYAYDAMGRTTAITAPDGGVTTFEYDGMGNLLRETNALGYTRVYTYDVYNRLVAGTDWAGNATRHEYDALGRLVRDIDPLDFTTVYTYDSVGNLAAREDKNGQVTTYTYDPNGNRLTETDPLGHTTTYVYDALNRVVEVITPCACAGGSHRYTGYDPAGRVVLEVDALGNGTMSSYDGVGRLTARTNPLGETTMRAYDAAGRLTLETDPLGQQTHYEYDLLGRVVTTTNRLGHSTVQHYDAAGRVVESIDERGFTTSRAYDPAGRVIHESDPLGYTTTYTYDLLGNKLAETDTLGHTQSYTYHANGWLLTETDANGHTTRYSYDALGRLVQKVDPLGGVTRYAYDPNGNFLTETDPLGYTTSYQYDAVGRRIAAVDTEGGETRQGYDDAGNLASRTDAEGNTWTYEYDANNNLIAETDPLGRVTRYEYDALDRPVKEIDPLGGISLTVYDELGRVAETVNAADQRTGYAYDAEGHLVGEIDTLGFYLTYTHDPTGNVVQMADGLGYPTIYVYDPLNRQTAATDAMGGISTWEYDALGRVITATDPLGRLTAYTYDPEGHLLAETNALGGITAYGYDARDRQVSVTDANDHTTITDYDLIGRALTTTLPSGDQISYTYDGVGNRLSETDAAGRTIHREYDRLGRITCEIDALGNATEYEYDAVGNLVLQRDALGHETQFTYDALNRLSGVTDPLGYETRYTYDPMGNLIQQQDANGNVTRYSYDGRNELTREINPLEQTWQYQYDAEGQQTGLMKPDGTTILYQYDPLGRLILTDYGDGTPDVAFTYSAAGQRLSMSDGTGLTQYGYDDLDRLVRIVSPIGEEVLYTYDAAGNRTGITYPDGRQAVYAYDADDHLLSVTAPEGWVNLYTRDATGLPQQVDYANGAYVTHLYDAAGRLVEVANGNGDGPFAHYGYTLDGLGNRVQEVQTLVEDGATTVVTTTYTYDARQELVASVASDGTNHHYEFDPAGNRSRMWGTRQGEEGLQSYSVAYAYNAANQLLRADDSVHGLTTYAFDDNGARIGTQEPGRVAAYGYDAEDRLIYAAVQVPDGMAGWVFLDGRTERYAYDGQSRRVSKEQVDASTSESLWQRTYLYGADWPVLTEHTDTPGGSTASHYVYDDTLNRLQATVDGLPGFVHVDGLGSVVGYTDAAGGVMDENGLREYGDYGTVERGGDAWFTDTAYTGHERESYSGLYYARHRYYDPETGRWFTLDSESGMPESPLSRHRYVYVGNNPISRADPLGLRQIRVGGLDLWTECQRYHKGSVAEVRWGFEAGHAGLYKDVAWRWLCIWQVLWWTKSERIDLNMACRMQHGWFTYARIQDPYDPYCVECVKDVPDSPSPSSPAPPPHPIAPDSTPQDPNETCEPTGGGNRVGEAGSGNGGSESRPSKVTTISGIAREAHRQWRLIPESERQALKHPVDHNDACTKCPVVNDSKIYTRCGDCFWFVGSVFQAAGIITNADRRRFKNYLEDIPDADKRVIWSWRRIEDVKRPMTWAELKAGDIHYRSGHALLLLNGGQVAHTMCERGGLVIESANTYKPTGKGVRIIRLRR